MKAKFYHHLSAKFAWLALVAVLLFAWTVPAQAQTTKPPLKESAERRTPDVREARRNRAWPFEGDKFLRASLIRATKEATGLDLRAIGKALRDGQSLAEIAVNAGKSEADILALYDQGVENAFKKAVEEGKLPQSVADSRSAWRKDVGRKMIDMPRLAPPFPGMHELHAVLITSAVRVSGLEREAIRQELMECRTLDEILVENGSDGAAAADAALEWLDGLISGLVDSGRLDQATSQEWHTSLEATLEKMVVTPGVHVAGVECAK